MPSLFSSCFASRLIFLLSIRESHGLLFCCLRARRHHREKQRNYNQREIAIGRLSFKTHKVLLHYILVFFCSPFEKLDHHEDDKRDGSQHDRHRIRANVVAVVKRPEDEEG